MSEYTTILNAMTQLEAMMADRDSAARAMGLLLLGERFDDDDEKEKKDPTELLFDRRFEDEWVPEW